VPRLPSQAAPYRATRPVREPADQTVTTRKIKVAIAAKHNPCLFLEEFDKFRPTNLEANVAFHLVNKIYEARAAGHAREIVLCSGRAAGRTEQSR
jgi:hypothetical protein